MVESGGLHGPPTGATSDQSRIARRWSERCGRMASSRPVIEVTIQFGMCPSRNSVEPQNSREPGKGPGKGLLFFPLAPGVPKRLEETSERDAHQSVGKKPGEVASTPASIGTRIPVTDSQILFRRLVFSKLGVHGRSSPAVFMCRDAQCGCIGREQEARITLS